MAFPNYPDTEINRPPLTPNPRKKSSIVIDVDVQFRRDKTVKEEILEECLLLFTKMIDHGSFYNSAIEIDPHFSGDDCEGEIKRLSIRIVKALRK